MAAETESPTTPEPGHDLSRRGMLRGAAVGGLALPVLAACGGDEEPATTSPQPSDTGGDTGDDAGGDAGAGTLASTGDVPVGGGTILADEQVVITQPSGGDFKAFTAVCTHQGCVVATVADGTINCNCHGSKFSIQDGSVASGPATSPLKAVRITVDGDAITRG
jgi:nitrite reductase/ring-hydroxylating ferredoxin subunit